MPYSLPVDPMDDKRGLRETFCDLSQARIAPHKSTWKHLRNTKKIGAMYYRLKKEDCGFTKQGLMQLYFLTHCLQNSLRERYA